MPRGEISAVDPAPRRSARNKDAAAAEVTAQAVNDDAAEVGSQPKLWDALKLNRIVCFVLRGDNPAHLHRSIRELFARWDPWSAGWRGAPGDRAHSSKAAQVRRLTDDENTVPMQCTDRHDHNTTQERHNEGVLRRDIVEGSAEVKNQSAGKSNRLLTRLASELVGRAENLSRGRA